MNDGQYRPSFKSISEIPADAHLNRTVKISEDPRFRRKRTDIRSQSTDGRDNDERHPQFVGLRRPESTPPPSTSPTSKPKNIPTHCDEVDKPLKLPPRPPPKYSKEYVKSFQNGLRPQSISENNDCKKSNILHVENAPNYSTATTIGSSILHSEMRAELTEVQTNQAKIKENYVTMQRDIIQRNEQLTSENNQTYIKQKLKNAPTQIHEILPVPLKEPIPLARALDENACRNLRACKSPSDTVLHKVKKLKIRQLFRDTNGNWTCMYRRNYYFVHGKLKTQANFELCQYCAQKSNYYAHVFKAKSVSERFLAMYPKTWYYSLLAIRALLMLLFISAMCWVLTNNTIWTWVNYTPVDVYEWSWSSMYPDLDYFGESSIQIKETVARLLSAAITMLLLPDIGNFW